MDFDENMKDVEYHQPLLGTLSVTSLTGHTIACITNTVKSCKRQENKNLYFHCLNVTSHPLVIRLVFTEKH